MRVTMILGALMFLIAPSEVHAQDEAKLIAAMRTIERDWRDAIAQQRPYISKCAEGTWSLIRFAPGGLVVSMDLRRTDSVISPYRGIVRFRSALESNSYSPRATGFFNKWD